LAQLGRVVDALVCLPHEPCEFIQLVDVSSLIVHLHFTLFDCSYFAALDECWLTPIFLSPTGWGALLSALQASPSQKKTATTVELDYTTPRPAIRPL
jgi:hypothetical protein